MGEILSLGVVRRTETGSTRGRCRQTSTVKTDHEGGETPVDCLFVSDARMKPGMRGVKAAGLRAPSKPLLHCGRNNDREVKQTRIVKVTVLL